MPLPVAGGRSSFLDKPGAVVDRAMIQNAMTTTLTDAKPLITADFLTHVAPWGGVLSLLDLMITARDADLDLAGAGRKVAS